MGEAVEFEAADAIDRLLAGAELLAPRQNLDPRQQFGEGIGLGQIIVAAGAQALDAVVNLPERREDQHRRLDFLRAQAADQGQPVELRQHAVDDENVIIALRGRVA